MGSTAALRPVLGSDRDDDLAAGASRCDVVDGGDGLGQGPGAFDAVVVERLRSLFSS
jgi:hypothetical protein